MSEIQRDLLHEVEPRAAGKSSAAFKTISEVSGETGVPQHVLRFWEAKFPQLRPMKRGGGRRYYRPEDVVLLQRIRRLLHDEGYTIKGVQKVLRDQRGIEEPVTSSAVPVIPVPAPDAFPRTRLALSGESAKPSRLVLDVELLNTATWRERLLRDVLEDLRDLRAALPNS